MIDVHCHLEQKDFEKDLDDVITRARKEIKGIITCCAHPDDFEISLQIINKFPGFVFLTASVHPEYVAEIDENKIEEYFGKLIKNKNVLVGIGETGLDYYWIKEEELRKKQIGLFIKHVELAKQLKLPLVIHCRDANKKCLEILERADVEKVHWHMFGAEEFVKQVVDNDWKISVGPIILVSKKHRRIVEKMPIENILLETDAPWMAPAWFLKKRKERNEPISIKVVAQEISKIKEMEFEEVWKICGRNAIKFFNLKFD